MAVYEPALMLQGQFSALDVILVVSKAVLAIMLWSAAMVGHWRMKLTRWERIGTIGSAVLLAAYLPWSDEIGLALAALLIVRHWRRSAEAPAGGSA
jgi:TRAP-type uncharacterized transport system fused permease subunit